jgi:hypothetical protein
VDDFLHLQGPLHQLRVLIVLLLKDFLLKLNTHFLFKKTVRIFALFLLDEKRLATPICNSFTCFSFYPNMHGYSY